MKTILLIVMTAALSIVLTTLYHKGHLPQMDPLIEKLRDMDFTKRESLESPPKQIATPAPPANLVRQEDVVRRPEPDQKPVDPVTTQAKEPSPALRGYDALVKNLDEMTQALKTFESKVIRPTN